MVVARILIIRTKIIRIMIILRTMIIRERYAMVERRMQWNGTV